MALSGKTVSLKYIIERVINTYGFDVSIYPEDVAENVFEAMGLIGAGNAYVRKQEDIVIENHRGELPCDLFEPISIKDAEYNYPCITDTGTFPAVYNDDDTSNDTGLPIRYNINDSYIFTSIKDGTLTMSYYAFPVDDEGLPLIPDDVRYIKAVVSYVAERIALKLWMKNVITEAVYRQIERDWLFYVNSAGNKAKMPNIDKLESIKNMVARMISRPNHHTTQFRYRNSPENLNIIE